MSSKPQYQIFIREMIRHGNQVEAYKAAFPQVSDETARTNSAILLKYAVIVQTLREQLRNIGSLPAQKAPFELKDLIQATALSLTEIRATLYKIAMGEIEVPVKKTVWSSKEKRFHTITVMETPDIMTRLTAIDLDNRIAGDYAPLNPLKLTANPGLK